jgi:hypothetical protein
VGSGTARGSLSGLTAPTAWLFSTAAYSGAAVLLSVLHEGTRSQALDVVNPKAACGHCAK